MAELRNKVFLIFARPYYLDSITGEPVMYKGAVKTPDNKDLINTNSSGALFPIAGAAEAGEATWVTDVWEMDLVTIYTNPGDASGQTIPMNFVSLYDQNNAPTAKRLSLLGVVDLDSDTYYYVSYYVGDYIYYGYVKSDDQYLKNIKINTPAMRYDTSPNIINREMNFFKDSWYLVHSFTSYVKYTEKVKELLTVYGTANILCSEYIPVDFLVLPNE